MQKRGEACRSFCAARGIRWSVRHYVTPRTRWRRRIFFALVLLVPLLLFLILFFGAAGVIRSVAEAALRANAASAMHEAIEATLSGVGYDDLIEVERSDTGEIAAMTADAQRINTIARDAAYLAQKNFKALAKAGVKVPLGAFSGIEALSGFGPPVTFKLLPVGAAHCSFRSAFTSAGINQTRHAVYLDIVLDITVVLPAGTSEFSESAEVMIIESVLSGEVPDFILHSDLFG